MIANLFLSGRETQLPVATTMLGHIYVPACKCWQCHGTYSFMVEVHLLGSTMSIRADNDNEDTD